MIFKYLKKINWVWLSVIAVLIRLLISQLGYNFDLLSYDIVSNIVLSGDNVYANTARYNYFYIWALLIAALKQLSVWFGFENIQQFHLLVCFFLSLVDVAIATILKRYYNKEAAILFLLNPVSIILTGFHSQFDNLAVLFGLLAWVYATKHKSYKPVTIGILLGLSIATKHILIFFLPVFLLIPQKVAFTNRMKAITISIAIPWLITLPFLLSQGARDGFLQNVLFYSSQSGGALLNFFFSKYSFLIFLVLLTGVVSKISLQKNEHAFFIYLIAIVGLSSSIADQYFAIPLISVVLFYKHVELRVYVIYVTLFLLLDSQNNIGIYLPKLIENERLIELIRVVFKAGVAQLLLVIFLLRYLFFSNPKKSLIT